MASPGRPPVRLATGAPRKGPAPRVVQYAQPRGEISIPFLLIRLLILGSVPMLVVTGLLQQIEMYVTGGAVPITPAVLKALLLGAFLAAALFRARISNPRMLGITLVFGGYLILNAIHLSFDVGLQLSDIFLGYNTYYFLFFADVLALIVPMRISDRLLLKIMGVLAVVNGALCLAQYVLQSPIVPTSSGDGNFSVLSWSNLGHMRAFGLFDEPAACGLFFMFVSALLVAFCARPRNRWVALPLLPVSIFLCWISGSRTEIAAEVCVLGSAAIFTFWKRRNRARFLPLLSLLSGAPVFAYAYIHSFTSGSTYSVTDTTSFAERLSEWSYYTSMLRSTTILNLLFGFGMVQNKKITTFSSALPVDNIYLSVALHIGVIGMLIFLALVWILWEEIRKKAETQNSYLSIAVASTFASFFLVGLFSIVTIFLAAMYLLFAVSRSENQAT
jgi:hypothetical protein